jgi:ABC-type transport system involved in multi-copper enzyme maturation permease subunit
MSTTITADVKLSALPPAAGKAGLRGVIASEFTKLRSVRSTYWTIGSLLVLSVGLAAAIGAGTVAQIHNDPGNKAGFDATQTSLGFFFYVGQLIIAVLGAMVITSEYSTGMIRTSLTAMPRRGVFFGSKLLVFTGAALVISLVTSFLAFFVGQAVMSGTGVSASLFHNTTVPLGAVENNGNLVKFLGSVTVTPGAVLTAIIGTALFVTVAAVIAFGLGAIIRHTAGAIASAAGLLFVLPIIIQVLPSSWRDDIVRFVPASSGTLLSATLGTANGDAAHLWSTWPQFGVTLIWAAVLVGVGAYLFRKRDA